MNRRTPPPIARRRLLAAAARVPLVGGLAAFGSSLLRFLKPNVDPLAVLAPTRRDAAAGEPVVAATLSEIARPWAFKYFVYRQRYPQYTPEGYVSTVIPGVVIRLPHRIRLPWHWVRVAGVSPTAESDIIAFSRICPHLGCIYNFVPDWREVTAGYGGYVPPADRRHALMACPCHLSIFDPGDPDQPGRVLSGPAPRPPRTFAFEVHDGRILVTEVEPGGIA
ncbi:MAG: Rieske 2Fe-2S domain-containing protein [Firmicutes bacterium]|nr:Rieske 2Fe-2S domain-containing protein [Bacillota bacterium]